MEKKYVKYGTLSLLYFVQGAPYGFQTGCLPLILRQSGLSFSSLGAMKLLFLPWVLKPFYATVIESTKSKQWWLMASLTLLCLTCLAATFTSLEMMGVIVCLMFLLNLGSAGQDICVDSLALQVLNNSELGVGNTIQVVAYKVGSVFAGAALLWVSELSSWSVMWSVFSALYLTCILLIISLRLGFTDSAPSSQEENSLSVTAVMDNWRRMLAVPGTRWMIMFVLCYKLCERGEGTLPLYLVDKAVPMARLAFWTGVVRSVASISGSALSGYLLSSHSFSPHQLLLTWTKIRIIPISLQLVIIRLWGSQPLASSHSLDSLTFDAFMFYSAVSSLVLANFCAGVITTATFTTMMRISQTAETEIQTSHYSLLATMEVLGKLMFASIAGWLIDVFGLGSVFVLFVMFSVLTVPLLWLRPQLQDCKLQD